MKDGHWAQQAAALLGGVDDADRRTDLQELFEERAAICEFEGCQSRTDAERLAYYEMKAAMDGFVNVV